jgi:FkbM family methyltransferase
MKYRVREFTLDLPDDHRLPAIQATAPAYDRLLDPIVSSVLRENPKGYVIDIGANVGDTAAIIRSCGDNSILCIEGGKTFIPLLRSNAKLIGGNIQVIDKFISLGSADTREYEYSGGTGSGGFIRKSNPESNQDETHSMISLRQLTESFRITRDNLTLFKTDTDGMDAFILRDFLDLNFSKTALFFECDPCHTIHNERERETWEHVIFKMARLGYSFLVFDNHGYPMLDLKAQEVRHLISLMDYIRIQYRMNFVHTHYLDVWALPNNMHQAHNEISKLLATERFETVKV